MAWCAFVFPLDVRVQGDETAQEFKKSQQDFEWTRQWYPVAVMRDLEAMDPRKPYPVKVQTRYIILSDGTGYCLKTLSSVIGARYTNDKPTASTKMLVPVSHQKFLTIQQGFDQIWL